MEEGENEKNTHTHTHTHRHEYTEPKMTILSQVLPIDHFSVVCLGTKSLSVSEAQVDLVLIQTLLVLICKSFSCYANQFLVSIMSRSTQISLPYRGLVTCLRTVKWSIMLSISQF